MKCASADEDIVVLNAFESSSLHSRLDIHQELVAVLAHLLCSVCGRRYSTKLGKVSESQGCKPLLSGSSAFGSKKRYCNPTMTELRLRTGFQSSRRMFKHTFPSRSTLGWYIWFRVEVSETLNTFQAHCLRALDLWGVVWVVGVDGKGKFKSATLVHACSVGGFIRAVKHWMRNACIPSSGVMVKLKLRRLAGSGKWVFIVGGRSSSVKSGASKK